MRYDVLLCDADNTLFDFNKAEENAFAIACETMGFSSAPELLATYSAINEALWKLLEQGKIEQSVLRVRRFEQFLAAIHKDGDAQRMCDAFVEALGQQSVPLDGAVEAVRRWSAKIPVVIVTNGIAQVQRGRMAKSELRPYISGLVISEEKGLLSPDRAASSGFRRFSIADVQRLGIIKSLQRQGFSLDEIKRILTKCALSDLIVMMDEKRAALREQIAQQNAVYERMTSGTDLLRDCRRLLMQPRLCMGCAAYLVDFDSVPALWTAVPKMPFLKDLIDALPLTNYCTTVPLALLNGQSAATRIGIVAPVEFTHVIHADFSQMRMSAGPQAVKIIFDLCPPEKTSLQPAIDLTRAFMQAHRLKPVCEGYTRQYAWFVDPDGQMRHYSELIVPVTAE